jgi:hypothetical protein
MVEADFMAEVVFTGAEVAGSSTSLSFSHRRMEKDLHLLNMRIERQVAPSRDGYRDFHLEWKEIPR